MNTFKELVKSLVDLHLARTENEKLQEELNKFMNSKMKMFQAKSETPSETILACLGLPKFYPRVAVVFFMLIAIGEDIDLKEEERIFNESNVMESREIN